MQTHKIRISLDSKKKNSEPSSVVFVRTRMNSNRWMTNVFAFSVFMGNKLHCESYFSCFIQCSWRSQQTYEYKMVREFGEQRSRFTCIACIDRRKTTRTKNQYLQSSKNKYVLDAECEIGEIVENRIWILCKYRCVSGFEASNMYYHFVRVTHFVHRDGWLTAVQRCMIPACVTQYDHLPTSEFEQVVKQNRIRSKRSRWLASLTLPPVPNFVCRCVRDKTAGRMCLPSER